MKKDNQIIQGINFLEDSLLVIILTTMIVLATYQVVARNFFAEGVVWIDPMLRTLVLWVALTGAIVATRKGNHIKVDFFSRYLPRKIQPLVLSVVYLFTSTICLVISFYGAKFVYEEYQLATIAFSNIPAWMTQIIIPLSFFLIAVRYLLLLIGLKQKTDVNL